MNRTQMRAALSRRLGSVLACTALVGSSLLLAVGPAAAANPIGHLDSVGYDIKYNTIDIFGWAGDPDAGSAPVRVHVYVDGVGAEAVSTGLTRTDVAAVHPGLGSHTGFYANPVQPIGRGPHTVCVYAINIAAGGNVLLGCRVVQVTLPLALLGHIDSIAVDPLDAGMRIAAGWVFDPADAVSPTPFALVRSTGPTTGTSWDYLEGSAGAARPDVDAVYPSHGSNHGFSVRFSATNVDWVAGDRICLALAFFVPGWVGSPTAYCATYSG